MPQRQKTEELEVGQIGNNMLNQPSALEYQKPPTPTLPEQTQPVQEVTNSIVGESAPDKEGASASHIEPDETSVLIQSSLAVLRAAELQQKSEEEDLSMRVKSIEEEFP